MYLAINLDLHKYTKTFLVLLIILVLGVLPNSFDASKFF